MSAQNNNYFLSEWFTFNYKLDEQGVQQIFIIIRAHNYSQNPRTGQVQYFECVKLENVWYSSHDGQNSDGHMTLNINKPTCLVFRWIQILGVRSLDHYYISSPILIV